ncbi:glucose-6-phosphate isomerase [Pasteurella multocida subsp. gallicida str. Anand1_poultry]|nr:glucose-6-phosphate isomerase [Pasteurella multocida subsp. gallicida str. Anand1_poultry]
MKNINPTTTNAWKALQQHHKTQSAVTIQQLFAQEKRSFYGLFLVF